MSSWVLGNALADQLQTLTVLEKVESFAKRNGGDRERAVYQAAVHFMLCEALDSLGFAIRSLHDEKLLLHPYAVQDVERQLDRALAFAEKYLGR